MAIKRSAGLACVVAMVTALAWGCRQEEIAIPVADNNATVAAGTEFVLSIEGNPTTGYAWFLLQDGPATGVTLLEKKFYLHEAGSGLAGAGGNYYFRLRADQPGDVRLHFAQRRPWEENQPAIENRYFYLTVE